MTHLILAMNELVLLVSVDTRVFKGLGTKKEGQIHEMFFMYHTKYDISLSTIHPDHLARGFSQLCDLVVCVESGILL